MTQVAAAREMARNAQWPPMPACTVDPAEVAAYLTGLAGESLTEIANRYGAGLADPCVPAEQVPGLLDLIEAGHSSPKPPPGNSQAGQPHPDWSKTA